MREIMFRGKREDNDTWVEGFYYQDMIYDQNNEPITGHFILCYCGDGHVPFLVQSETVGQYIGLTDKKGKKIFEGDFTSGGYKVVWLEKQATFVLTKKSWIYYHYFFESVSVVDGVADIEVIGNIYDNPEWMKGQ